MDIQIVGTITKIYPIQSGVSKASGNEWCKQEYMLNVEGEQYEKKVVFQIFGKDRIENAGLQLNERVRVHLEITANEYNERGYNTISCWKVDRNSQQNNQTGNAPQQPVQQQQFPPQVNNQGVPQQQAMPQTQTDDLPF